MNGDDTSLDERLPYDETILTDPTLVAGTRILLHAERPNVTKTWIRGRLAVVTRKTVTTRKTFEVDVKHEELVVEYEAGDGTPMLERGSDRVVVELRAEHVELVKTVRVVEEVSLSKRLNTEAARVDVALRHERLAHETF